MTSAMVPETMFKGIAVAPGIAIGPAYVFTKDEFTAERSHVESAQVEAEVQQFERAVVKSERELKKIAAVAGDKIGSESAHIFKAQALMVRDIVVYNEVVTRIREEQVEASYAVQKVMEAHRHRMERSGNEYLRERAQDLFDVQSRLQRHLQHGTIVSKISSNTIVVAEELTAADIILFSRRNILGCATSYGGPTSHVSLMARALGIPSVVSLHNVIGQIHAGDPVILDGLTGRLIVRPDEATLHEYKEKRQRYEQLMAERETLIPLASETLDGTPIQLSANIEVEEEYPFIKTYRADGIGLFRTEMLFLAKGTFPSEEEQVTAYRNAIAHTTPAPTTFRLFDLGGDKVMPMGHRERNPFLGWRGIRILLDRREVLEAQLRAILRAAVDGPSRILIPMVTSISEIRAFYEVLEQVKADLEARGLDFADEVPIGVMIEVPGLALIADDVARSVDFFSVGTNDLTQYILAVDRGNDLVSDYYQELHPGLLKVLRMIVETAERHDIPVSICGEMAARPVAVPVLLGLGFRSFSASPAYLSDVKRVVRAITIEEAETLARDALSAESPDAVKAQVEDWLRTHHCGIRQLVEMTKHDLPQEADLIEE